MSITIMKQSVLTRKIKNINDSSAKLLQDVHSVGLNAIYYAAQYGDVTIAQKLLAACHKGVRRESLIEWLVSFGLFARTEDEGGNTTVKYHKRKEYDLEAALELADETPFWELFKEQKPKNEVDVFLMLKTMLKNAQKKVAQEGITIKHGDLLPVIASIVDGVEHGANIAINETEEA